MPKVYRQFFVITDRKTDHVSPKWKLFTILIFVICACAGFVTCYTFTKSLSSFNNYCYLYARVEFDYSGGHTHENKTTNQTEEPDARTVKHSVEEIRDYFPAADTRGYHTIRALGMPPIRKDATEWGKMQLCYFVQYTPLVSTISCMIWATFFLITARGGGGQPNDLISDPWRLVYPCLVYSTLFSIVNLAVVSVMGGGGGLFCKSWSEEWFVLYDDSTLAWYADKGLSRPRGRIRISDAPDLLAVGEWTRQVPKRPRFPRACHVGQLIALGSRLPHDVHWLMAQSPAEVNDWMTAISNTLPPPPHLPLENKPVPLTPKREICPNNHPPPVSASGGGECSCGNGIRNHQLNGGCCQGTGGTGGGRGGGGGAGTAECCSAVAAAAVSAKVSSSYDADHTVLSGVVIDWGHGWGWGQGAWAAQSACAAEAAVSSALYCHALGDYSVSGFEEVDWSAFGDFSF